jgi:hypothetical protein
MGGQLAEYPRRFTSGVVRYLETLARDPASDRDRGVRADPLESLLDRLIDHFAADGGHGDGL